MYFSRFFKLSSNLILFISSSILMAMAFAASCRGDEVFGKSTLTTAPPEFLQSRWDSEGLAKVESKWQLLLENKKSSALVVLDSGYVVLSLGGKDVGRPIQCHSIRKSFLHALYGRLDSAGKLDLNQSMADIGIAKQAKLDEQEGKATLGNLLQCRSGIYLPAEAETNSMKRARPMRGSHVPGSFYYYNNWDFNAAGAIFTQIDGRSVFEAFQQEIAKPLGMRGIEVRHHILQKTNKSSLFPAYIFRVSAMNRARFGQLYLRNGSWNGRQIVPAEFIRDSLLASSTVASDPHAPMLGIGKSYGSLWWVGDTGWLWGQKFAGRPFSARGVGGNYIGVIPSEDLVVVHVNDVAEQGNSDPGSEWNELFSLIRKAKRPTAKKNPTKNLLLESDPPGFQRACQTLIPQLQTAYRVPGVSIAVVEGGKIKWSQRFGMRHSGSRLPVTSSTRFEAASMSKPVFTYGVLKLVEQGRLDLDRPLVEYLDEIYLKNEQRHKRITARMVLSHRSGFPNWRVGGYSPETLPPQPLFEPGSQQRYSGEGFTFLQKAVEKITGMSLDDFTTKNVFQPLGMTESRFIWDDVAEIAAAHLTNGKVHRADARYRAGNSAFTLFTTATDYAKFLTEIMKVDRQASHSVSAEMIDEMLRSHSKPGDLKNFALSWVIQPNKRGFSHTGSNPGFRCGAWFDPESKLGIVLLTNGAGGERLRDQLFEIALGEWR